MRPLTPLLPKFGGVVKSTTQPLGRVGSMLATWTIVLILVSGAVVGRVTFERFRDVAQQREDGSRRIALLDTQQTLLLRTELLAFRTDAATLADRKDSAARIKELADRLRYNNEVLLVGGEAIQQIDATPSLNVDPQLTPSRTSVAVVTVPNPASATQSASTSSVKTPIIRPANTILRNLLSQNGYVDALDAYAVSVSRFGDAVSAASGEAEVVPGRPELVTATELILQETKETQAQIADVTDAAADEKRTHLIERSITDFVLLIVCSALLIGLVARRRIRRSLRVDELTGLLAREGFRQDLEKHLLHLGNQAGGTILVLDIDHFSDLNRAHGSSVGDEVLQEVGHRLREACAPGDVCARIGADVFAVFAIRAHEATAAESIADRILRSVSAPLNIADGPTSVTASIGIAPLEAGLRDVDAALERGLLARSFAQRGSRGSVRMYEHAFAQVLDDEAKLEGEMREGLKRNEFVAYFQPEVDFRTGNVLGMEALVRWMHPDRGMVSPADFIPLAESTGLVVELGEQVLFDSCRKIARWNKLVPDAKWKMRVNLSARQLENDQIVHTVRRALELPGMVPSLLCLEVTESMIMLDAEKAMTAMFQLVDMGVHLAIDDFGTGHSSLSYLSRFPVDVLKIDRSFVQGVDTDGTQRAIVNAVIGLGRALGLTVTAEGVETDEQREMLVGLGCVQGQGFFFAKPMSGHDLEKRLISGGSYAELLANPTRFDAANTSSADVADAIRTQTQFDLD